MMSVGWVRIQGGLKPLRFEGPSPSPNAAAAGPCALLFDPGLAWSHWMTTARMVIYASCLKPSA